MSAPELVSNEGMDHISSGRFYYFTQTMVILTFETRLSPYLQLSIQFLWMVVFSIVHKQKMKWTIGTMSSVGASLSAYSQRCCPQWQLNGRSVQISNQNISDASGVLEISSNYAHQLHFDKHPVLHLIVSH